MKRIILFFFLSSTTLLFAGHIEKGPAPEWVNPQIPDFESEVSKYDVIGGAYNAVLDYQSNLITKDDYTMTRIMVLTESGVDMSSEIAIMLDTIYNDLVFHYLKVTRNGEVMDRTEDLELEYLSYEGNLDQRIYTGAVTAYGILQDIRKGDIVEYAYTVTGENPIFEGRSYRSYTLTSLNPIDLLRVRVIKNPEDDYYISGMNMDKVPKWQGKGSHEELNFIVTNSKAYEMEDTSPSWYIGYPSLFITSYKSMREVNEWAMEIFKLEEESAKAMNGIVDEILSDEESTEDKIDAIIRWVQNDIRYMGIESGIGAIKPFQPIETVNQRFGDCKDKTLLLISLLKEIGVKEAYPFLVNTSFQHKIDEIPPGAQLFDHVIAVFDYNGERYFIDPTVSFQGGKLGKRTTYDYGKGLIVKEGGGLVKMKLKEDPSKVTIYENFEIPDFKEPSSITVVTVFTGTNADAMRMILDMMSVRELSKEFMSVYGVLYDVTEKEKLKVSDDFDENVLEIVETYQAHSIFDLKEENEVKFYQMHYEPLGLYDYITSLSCEAKKHPIYVPFPSNYSQKTEMTLPSVLAFPAETYSVNNAAFTFSSDLKVKGLKRLEINYDYRTKTMEIENIHFNRVCRDMQDIIQKTPFTLSFPK